LRQAKIGGNAKQKRSKAGDTRNPPSRAEIKGQAIDNPPTKGQKPKTKAHNIPTHKPIPIKKIQTFFQHRNIFVKFLKKTKSFALYLRAESCTMSLLII